MSLPAIEVTGVSKRYVIQHESRHDNLRDQLHHTARKLWRRYRWGTGFATEEFWALRDVSFAVQPGEVVGIVGRNGAGKSTLLKILSRITEPTSGRITLRGRVASLLEVGTGFHPELTGRENIFLNGAILGMRRAEIRRKFDEIVAFAEVERFLDTPVKRYSSGMYVRLAFAVAAHLEPEILIVDEVLAVGDSQFQKKCLGKIRQVSEQEGRTVLFVSHNIPTVLGLCSRALLLNCGQLVTDGTPSEIISRYAGQDQGENEFQPERGERSGDGRARIVSFRINPAPPQTGKPLEFLLGFQRDESVNHRLPLEVAVAILTEQDVPLFQLFSVHMGARVEAGPGVTRVRIRLENLPLVHGRYRVNLWLGSGRQPIDWIKGAYLLSVAPGTMAGDAIVESRGYPFVMPASWRCGE